MPRYEFINKNSGETTSEWLSYTELDEFLAKNPDLEQTICAPVQMDSHKLGRMKPDNGFREILNRIKKNHPGNTVDSF